MPRVEKRSIGRSLAALLALAALAAGAPGAAAAGPALTLTNYPAPPNTATDAGEPSIGVDLKTGKVFFQSNVSTYRVDFSKLPPTWTDVTAQTATISLDPILFTDNLPDGAARTFSSQLLLACSQMDYSDDDGQSWSPSQGCGIGSFYDHQTVGGGPFSPNGPGPTGSYPHAIYYCAQFDTDLPVGPVKLAGGRCGLSRDGGQTFGAAVLAYTLAQCPFTLHGHIKVDRGGTAYLPNFDCGGKQTLATTKDNGQTWTLDKVPDSTTQDESDPHLGIGDRGTLYFGYQGGDGLDLGDKGYLGHARSEGARLDRRQAGGRDRVGPVRRRRGGARRQERPVPRGLRGGRRPRRLRVPGHDDDGRRPGLGLQGRLAPLRRLHLRRRPDVDDRRRDAHRPGPARLRLPPGRRQPCRNLLDFNDIGIDAQGRVLVAYADGCTGACVTDPNDYKDKDTLGTIARQEGGMGLRAAFDSTSLAGPSPESPLANGPAGQYPSRAADTTGSPACTAAGTLRATVGGSEEGVRFAFERGQGGSVSVDLFQQSQGRRVLGERLVRRFGLHAASFTWNGRVGGRRVPDGVYFVRFSERLSGGRTAGRRLAFSLAHGRLRVRPAFYGREGCSTLRFFKLERPVFGGVTHRPLSIAYRLNQPGTVTVKVTRGTRTVLSSPAASRQAGRTYRLRLPAGRLPRGDYRVTVTVARAGTSTTSTLTSRLL